MPAHAIILAALLLGDPPVTYGTDASWEACQSGEPKARVEGCARIANDPQLELPERSWALVLRATAHADAEEPEAAIVDLDRAVRMNPQSSIGYRLKGEIEAGLKRFDAALADIDHAIDLNADDPYNLLSKAMYFRMREKYGEARDTVEAAIGLDPDLPESYFERGRIVLAEGDGAQAVLDFEKFKRLRPDDLATDYNLGLAYRAAGRLLDADAAMDRVLRQTPDDVDARQIRAGILRALGDTGEALDDLAAAIALAPQNLSLIYDRGNLRSDIGAWDDAIADFTAALPGYPDEPAVLVNRGYAHFRNGADEKALADADAALAIDAKDADAYWLKASASLYLERYDDVLEAAKAGLAEAPDDTRFLVLRGRALLAENNAVAAIVPLSEALIEDPDASDAVIYRAAALAKIGMTAPALSALHGVLETDQNNVAALEQAVIIQRKIGDYEGALSNVLRLIEQLPDVPVYSWEKGECLFRLGYQDTAPDAYLEAVALYGDAAPTDLMRDAGASLIQSRRYQEAIDILTTALSREPDDAWTVAEIGLADHLADRNEQAVIALQRAITLYAGAKDGDVSRLNLADSYAALGNYGAALDEYDRLLIDYPGDEEVLSKRGAAYRGLKQAPGASAALVDRLREPQFLDKLFKRIDALRKQGDLKEGLALVDKAIDAAPDSPQAYFIRAWLRRETKDYALALQDLDHTLELQSVTAGVLNNRADILLLMGRIKDARTAAEKATSQYPKDGTSWVTLGQTLIEMDDLQEAVAALNKGVELGPASKADAYFYRALAHFRLGETDAARRDLGMAATFDQGELAAKIAELRRKLS